MKISIGGLSLATGVGMLLYAAYAVILCMFLGILLLATICVNRTKFGWMCASMAWAMLMSGAFKIPGDCYQALVIMHD